LEVERSIEPIFLNDQQLLALVRKADDSHKPLAFSIFEFCPGVHISEVSNEHKIPLSFELGRMLTSEITWLKEGILEYAHC